MVWRRDEDCTVVRSSHPQTSPPSGQPAAIWRSSIPQWSPEEPVPAAADGLEGSQPGVRGPVRDFPTQPKQFPFLSKGHFNFSCTSTCSTSVLYFGSSDILPDI